MKPIRVICMGILALDVFCPVIPRLPRPGELIAVDDISCSSGGVPANTAVCLSKLGISSGTIGKVGRDSFGNFIIDYLRKSKVDTSGITRSDKRSTSKTVILLTEDEDRRFIHGVGANAELGVDDIDFDYVARSEVVYVGGYLGLPKLDQASLVKLFEFAKRRGIITVLDVIVPRSAVSVDHFMDVLRYTDFFLPNQDEARMITGSNDPEDQAAIFLRYNPGMTLVITMGKKGALLRTQEKVILSSSYQVKTVDPSGGGDAFNAGFIVGVLEGWEFDQTLKFASALGASAVTRVGATTGIFTREEALRFIENHELRLKVLPKVH